MYVYTYIHMYKYANNSQIYISSPDLNLHIFLTLYLMFPLEYSTDTSNSAHTEFIIFFQQNQPLFGIPIAMNGISTHPTAQAKNLRVS